MMIGPKSIALLEFLGVVSTVVLSVSVVVFIVNTAPMWISLLLGKYKGY